MPLQKSLLLMQIQNNFIDLKKELTNMADGDPVVIELQRLGLSSETIVRGVETFMKTNNVDTESLFFENMQLCIDVKVVNDWLAPVQMNLQ